MSDDDLCPHTGAAVGACGCGACWRKRNPKSDIVDGPMSLNKGQRDIDAPDLLITSEALDNFYGWVREAQQLRVVLADLIAELRNLNQNRDGGMWADDVHDAADRAEARLREVSDE